MEELRRRQVGELTVCFGTVDVTHQVVGYQRRRIASGEVLGEEPLDLPPRELRTRAVWYLVPPATARRGPSSPRPTCRGPLHAAEHAAIGLLPLWATCDRWDIGGVSTALHPDTGETTVFVYDGAPGGAGFAERGFQRVTDGWRRRRRRSTRASAGGLPVVRAIAQVRQRQRAAGQGRRFAAAD